MAMRTRFDVFFEMIGAILESNPNTQQLWEMGGALYTYVESAFEESIKENNVEDLTRLNALLHNIPKPVINRDIKLDFARTEEDRPVEMTIYNFAKKYNNPAILTFLKTNGYAETPVRDDPPPRIFVTPPGGSRRKKFRRQKRKSKRR
jgi:hypothetical protein